MGHMYSHRAVSGNLPRCQSAKKVRQKKRSEEDLRHQDTLYPRSGGVQPKLCASIVNQIKLDIPAASQLLPPLFLGCPFVVHVFVDDGHVGREECG